MKRTSIYPLLAVVLVLFLAALACGPQPTEVPQSGTSQQNGGQQPLQPGTGSSSGTPTGSLSSAQRQALMHSTVQILMLYDDGGELKPRYSGSGTILSPDGIILTNCHVAAPDLFAAANGGTDEPVAGLGVSIVDRADQPPVPTYLAEVLAADGTLDLAVIRITRMLDGSPVSSSDLNLPYVSLGDSDQVELGDPVFVFGFPTIGGETITYTTGSVSGFDSMDPIGERAWIKTDAMIAGGNSGGLAANDRGEIIGVPSRGGTSSASDITDCRQIADTNGDGVVDEKDTCVPMGGFINAIRPVKWSLPLIDVARNGMAYASPYGEGQVAVQEGEEQPVTTDGGQFTFSTWSMDTDSDNCPVTPVQGYSSGTKAVHANFKYRNMSQGEKWGYRWLIDGREVFSTRPTWTSGSSGKCFDFSLDNGGKAMPNGAYKLEVYAGTSLTLAGVATGSVGGSGGTQPGGTSGGAVQLQGKVTDANTGRGISGVLVIILKPGIDPDQWINDENTTDDDIMTYTKSDNSGNYRLPDALKRGPVYGIVAGSSKLDYPPITGTVSFDNDSPDIVSLNLQLSK